MKLHHFAYQLRRRWRLWTHLRCEGSKGSEGSEGSEGKVDGASPRGFLRFLSLTAPRAEGCGIALRAMSIKSTLRDWLSMSYGMIIILLIGSLRSPPPIRLCRTSPLFRGQNRALCFPAETWPHD